MKIDPTTPLRQSVGTPGHTHVGGREPDREIPEGLLKWIGTAAPRSRIVSITDVERNEDHFRDMLATEEREHVARCRSRKRRLELMGSRFAVKTIVQAYIREFWNLDLPPHAIRVAKRPPGSPYIIVSLPQPAAFRLPRLSLSHNRLYCWAALAGDRFRIGVDVQEVQARILRLAPYFLTSAEMEIAAGARNAGKKAPDASYTAAWSAKEAAFKCVCKTGSFRKFCNETRIVRKDEKGVLLTYGLSDYFVRQILSSRNVFSVISTPEA